MTPEIIIWHMMVETDRLENAGPLSEQERSELRNIVERLWAVLTEDTNADAA